MGIESDNVESCGIFGVWKLRVGSWECRVCLEGIDLLQILERKGKTLGVCGCCYMNMVIGV